MSKNIPDYAPFSFWKFDEDMNLINLATGQALTVDSYSGRLRLKPKAYFDKEPSQKWILDYNSKTHQTISNSNSVPASFADLAERLMPSVVNISTTQTVVTNTNPLPFTFPPGSPFEDMFREFGTPQERKSSALGSGFIIDEKGLVVTNNHVIQGAEDIIVRVNGDQEYNAKVIGADPLSDIAVLQLETDEKFIPVQFGDSDKARIGDWVIAIGNPFGLGGTVTSGIISARNRSIGLSRYEDYIQTDASINSGNSGGPLFDMNGDVIGINTAILGRSGSIGIGFSIPSNSAKLVIDQLIKFGETKRGWLGVRIQDVTKEILPTQYSQCHMYVDGQNHSMGQQSCINGYEFHFEHGNEWNIIAEWGLVCNRQ